MKEYWINVYGRGLDKAYGYFHESKKEANEGNSWAKGEAIAVYRIHVKIGFEQRSNRWPNGYPLKMVNGEIMTNVAKPNLKVFGIDIPGVKAGDGVLKPKYKPLGIHEKWMEF